jgi:hypothetical protein
MLSFGLVGILSIGGPLLVPGLVLFGVTLGRAPRWPAVLGAISGVGIAVVLIGAIGHRAAPGIWAVSGASLVAAGATAFWWLRCRATA